MERIIPEETIRQATSTSIGGKFFKTSTKERGIDTIVLNSVVYMNGLFDPDDKNPRCFHELEGHYKILSDHGQNFFFNFNNATAAGDYGVFSFHTDTGWKALSDLTLPLNDEQALAIFKALVEFIYNYSQSVLNTDCYHPLLFICKESVYFKYTGDKLEIKLLPLLYDPNTQYPGMPKEVFADGGDITSDLFMAAYLYLSLKYPNGENFETNNYSKYVTIAERCLSIFRQRRYGVEQLLSLLNDAETAQESQKPVRNTSGPIVVSSNNTTNSKKNNDSNCEKKEKPKFSFLQRLLMKIIPMKNRVFDATKVAAKVTSSGEKISDLLSTEEADKQEENND